MGATRLSASKNTGGLSACTTAVSPYARFRGRQAARAPVYARPSRKSEGLGPTKAARARTGRQPSLSEQEVRLLVRAAANGDCFAKELKTVKASVRTIQRLLKSVDHLVNTKMDRTLPLTAAHKTARMDWAEEHILKPGKSA
ncbi:hypothetical protein PI125_g10089 [Phytophthora idaei]|nr:hypothetical protein PI125_g10089 [Phytophthora idaei]KAG3165376.1 hypothetical protein PI126_g4655 [Phytophthora idaei]